MTALTKFFAALIALAALLLGLSSSASAAQSSTRNAFGAQAVKVADWGHCKNPRKRSGEGDYALSGVVCDLKGQRINVITFSDKRSEVRWLNTACTFLPQQWVMIGIGFVITAYDGNKAAAKTGSRVYGGDSYVCSDLV